MISLETMLALTPTEIEIHVLQNLAAMDRMVGKLYPSILRDENEKLRARWVTLTGKACRF